MKINRIILILLINIILIFTFCPLAFALGEGNLVNSDISTWDKHSEGDIVNTSETLITAGVNAGYNNIYIDSDDLLMESYVYYYEITDLINGHNYKVAFDMKMLNGFAQNYWVLIGVMCVYDNKNPYESQDNNYNIFFDSDKDRKSDDFHFDINIAINETKPYKAYITIGITNKVNNPTNRNFLLGNFSVVDLDDDSGLFESIKNWLSRVYHSIAGGIDSEGVNHIGFGGYITMLRDSEEGFFGALISDIATRFSNITSSISEFFGNLITNLTTWFNELTISIGDFFDNLSDNLLEYINKLKNWLLWFNAEGSSSYENPFDNINDDIEDDLESNIVNLANYINDNTNSVSESLSNIGSVFLVLDTFVIGIPIVLSLIIFAFFIHILKRLLGF